jgi:hypothetical protein
MKARNLLAVVIVLASFVAFPACADNNNLVSFDTDSANVTMSVGLYASLTGLDGLVLMTIDAEGAAGAVYDGSDVFNLESNGQVRVTLSEVDMVNGSDTLDATCKINGQGTFNSSSNVVHNQAHTVTAKATLGAISALLWGSYASSITLAVSAL